MADSVLHGNKIEGIRIKDVKIMAKKFLYAALAGVGMLLAGCSEDVITNDTQAVEKHVGDEIMFGGSASYDTNRTSKTTRTEYGGYENIDNGAEPVYWTQGDDVRVYCPEGVNNTADYDVDVTGEKVITTSLSRRGDYSLQWGESLSHTFYAVYPAPATTIEGSDLNGSTSFTGEIPAMQEPANYIAPTEGGYSHVFTPDMNYAYMMAKTYVPDRNKIGTNVYLQFRPMATAVEVTLQNNTARNLTFQQIQCYSEAGNIAGTFTAELGGMTEYTSGTMQYATGYPAITVGEGEDAIIIPMQDNAGQDIVVKLGQSVTFTVFMLPNADVNDLQISLKAVLDGETGYKTGTLNGVTIQKHKKTYLRNLSLSAQPYTDAEWLKYVDDQKVLNALSIPAAGGAASGDLDGNGQYTLQDESRQQNLSIKGLWDTGIRCFEFATDIYKYDEATGQNTTEYVSSLGDAHVICNGLSVGYTLDQAINDVVSQLSSHPDEFAMLILTYQTLGGWNLRTPSKYMELLNAYYTNTVSGKLKSPCSLGKYTPATTMKDARGKLFCIARPTSENQDYGSAVAQLGNKQWWTGATSITTDNIGETGFLYTPSNENIVLIHGWGALKDKWQQRGYTADQSRQTGTNGRPFDVATLWSYAASGLNFLGAHYGATKHEDWNVGVKAFHDNTQTINAWYGNLPKTDYKPSGLTTNFSYKTTLGDANLAWVQEWARVSNWGNTISDILAIEQKTCSSHSGHDEVKAIYWTNTRQEKINNMTECLDLAISKGKANHTIYINSLCGYYITPQFRESYLPCILTDWNSNGNKVLSIASQTAGMQGDIGTFAKDINEEFYSILDKKTQSSNIGSMGIIMMDRVGEYEASKRIPQIIVANNFQFALKTTLDLTKGGNVKQEDVVLSREQKRGTKTAAPIITWE